MPDLVTTSGLDQTDRDAVIAFLADETSRRGHRPLSDQLWLDLTAGEGRAVTAVTLRDGDRVVGYAQGSPGHSGTIVQVVTAGDDPATVGVLLDAATSAAPADRPIEWLVFGAGSGHDELAAPRGFVARHEVVQMRRPLPIDQPPTAEPVPTRPFRVGVDEEDWLRVNARAFAGHAEQGSWDLTDLSDREAEPWFDPDGFLVHERDGRMAAFCWTKVHADEQPPAGEIYVIAVDPDFHGLGLGRALTVAGLRHLTSRGITSGMLFVDGDNVAALSLYESLGFSRSRVDRVYEKPPATGR